MPTDTVTDTEIETLLKPAGSHFLYCVFTRELLFAFALKKPNFSLNKKPFEIIDHESAMVLE